MIGAVDTHLPVGAGNHAPLGPNPPAGPRPGPWVEPAGATPQGSLSLIDLLLRDRAGTLARIRAGSDLKPILTTMVATIAVSMAIVGAALGTYRGGIQIAYAAIKLPLVLLGAAALSAPALSAIGAALGRRSRLSADLALVMSAVAFGALLLASTTPLILLGRSLELDYHRMIAGTVCIFTVAGCATLRMIVQGVAAEHAPGWRSAIAGLCCVFALVGAQLAWAMRPYLVRPRAPEVPFVRAVEGSLFDAIVTTFESAQGHYTREAPLPGHDTRMEPATQGGTRMEPATEDGTRMEPAMQPASPAPVPPSETREAPVPESGTPGTPTPEGHP